MKDLTQGSVFKHLVLFALPMLLGNVFQQLYNVVDSLIVGRLVGVEALAAVGASFPVLFILTSLIMGLTMGMSVVISQFYGAKDLKKVGLAIDSMMIFIIGAGLVVGLIGICSCELIFKLMNIPDEVRSGAVVYFRILIAGAIFMFSYNGVSAILRGLGDSKTPLYFLMIATSVNIVLDITFIVVFKMGVAGVSLATVISQAVATSGLIIYINTKHKIIKIKFKDWNFDKDIFFKSIKIGLPQGIQQTVVAVSMIAIMSLVGNFGPQTIAGFTVAMRLDSFAMMPIMTLSLTLTSFVGQNVGAGKYDRAKKGYKSALFLSMSSGIILGCVFVFFGKFLAGFFTDDAGVILVASQYLATMGGFFWVLAAMFMTNGMLRGAGDAFIPMLLTVTSLIFVRVPVAIYLSREAFGLGSRGIWWGAPIGWCVGFILTFAYYKTGRWKHKAVVRKMDLREPEPLPAIVND